MLLINFSVLIEFTLKSFEAYRTQHQQFGNLKTNLYCDQQ